MENKAGRRVREKRESISEEKGGRERREESWWSTTRHRGREEF